MHTLLLQAVKLSMVIGDSAAIRLALRDYQMKKYGKTKAIASNCPTRFAIVVTILQDLIDTEDALRALVESPDWKEVSKDSTNAGEMRVMWSLQLQPNCHFCFVFFVRNRRSFGHAAVAAATAFLFSS